MRSELLEKLLEAMRNQGLAPSPGQSLEADGNLHRYHIDGDKPRTKNGAYQIFLDEHPAAWFKSWRDPDRVHTVSLSSQEGVLSVAQKERMYRELEERKAEREANQAQLAAAAAKEALLLWEQGTLPEKGEYLFRKNVPPHGLRALGEVLLVPLTDISGKIQNLQQIYPNGGKRFLKHGAVKGNFCSLPGDRTAPILLCEGWATGASLHEATGWSVICAMNAGNLLPVASVIRKRFPDRGLIICADDDWPGPKILEAMQQKKLSLEELAELGISRNSLKLWTTTRATPPPSIREKLAEVLGLQKGQLGNPGIEKAQAVVLALGGVLAQPPFGVEDPGSDWNDYASLYGLPSIREQLESLWAAQQEARGEEENVRENSIPSPWDVFDPIYISNKGKPLGNLANLRSLLSYYHIQCRYNQITKDAEVDVQGSLRGDNSENASLAEIYSRAAEHGFPTPNMDTYLSRIALENQYNPVRDWISRSPWDGIERLSLFFETISLAPGFPEGMKRILMTKWLTSAVAAAFLPENFLCRGVLVLQGPQGIGKTSWFRNLVPHESGWFGEGRILDPADKDSVYGAISYWIVELGELEATFKKADLARLKAFLTSQSDKLRLPYGRRQSTFARRTVFAASVNSPAFLLDDTGNSRWWVLPCQGVSFNHGIDMQQLWAEIYHCYYRPYEQNGGRYLWWLTPEEEETLSRLNREYEAADPVEELILAKLDWDTPREYWEEKSASEILQSCGVAPVSRASATKAGSILAKLCGPCFRRNSRRLYHVPPRRSTGYLP